MKYSKEEVLEFVREEDVKFIRLVFCDVFGRQKNVSIMPDELPRAFEYGISFDASAIAGFGDEVHCDLFLHPDPDTITQLPWRPEHGRVVRMFSTISYPDGTPFECDTRGLLKKAIADAKQAGVSFRFGVEQEFYLFKLDETGRRTMIPYDEAGYMDIAPADRGENVRREICLTLEQMGIHPESSHHEAGPGQNEIDFRYSDALTAADNAMTLRTVVSTSAQRNGLWADFSPKPLVNEPGNGFHINMSISPDNDNENMHYMVAGVMDKIRKLTAFLNPSAGSYDRLGSLKAPGYVTWSRENRSQLIRIPAAVGEYRRAELRSPDPATNPYLALALIIYAGLHGLKNQLELPKESTLNLYKASAAELAQLRKLPSTLAEAKQVAAASSFIKSCIPAALIDAYCAE